MTTKNIFKSKTAALALITTLAGVAGQFYPAVAEWTTAHSSDILVALGAVAMVLRLVTKDKITLFPQAK